MADEPKGEGTVYRSQADVRVARLSEKERTDLLELARKRAPDPSVFDDEEPFFWMARSSNDKVDAYFTWMDESSLQNYARDATDPGVQFQVSHNGGGGFFGPAGEVGFGRSLRGEVKGSRSKECLIDFYTIRGLSCGNVSSEQFINGARSGIYADVSIGFMPGEMICNICGNDFLRKYQEEWDSPQRCTHWPGNEYEVEKGSRTEKITCILQVKDGRLNEVSLVYDGATPGAGIAAVDMARMAAAHGDLNREQAQTLENLYRVRIDPSAQYINLGALPNVQEARGTMSKKIDLSTDSSPTAVAQPAEERQVADPQGGENPSPAVTEREEEAVVIELSEETTVAAADPQRSSDPMERLRQKYDGKLRFPGNDPIKALEVLADRYIEQHGRITTLTKEAEYGRQAREELLTDLDTSVVRAFGAAGADENKARYRKMAASLDAPEVRVLIADLENKATARLGMGGRLTVIDTTTRDEGDEEGVDRKSVV